MRSTDHQQSSRFTPLNLSRNNGVFASVLLSNQPYQLLFWRCIFETPIRRTSALFVNQLASPRELAGQASCLALPPRGSAYRNRRKGYVLSRFSIRRILLNLQTRTETTTSRGVQVRYSRCVPPELVQCPTMQKLYVHSILKNLNTILRRLPSPFLTTSGLL